MALVLKGLCANRDRRSTGRFLANSRSQKVLVPNFKNICPLAHVGSLGPQKTGEGALGSHLPPLPLSFVPGVVALG